MNNKFIKIYRFAIARKYLILSALFVFLVNPAQIDAAINASRIYQLQQRIIENPRDVESHLNLAMEYAVANDLIKSVQAYFELLKIDPKNFHAYNNLGVLYKQSGQYKDSLHCYEQAEKIDPESPWVPYNMGLCYESMGRIQDARESYGKALSLDPTFDRALKKLRILSDPNASYEASANLTEAYLQLAAKPVIVESKEEAKKTVKVEKPKVASVPKQEKISEKLKKVKETSREKFQHRTTKTGPAASFFNQAMDAFEINNMEKAIELYVSSIIADRSLLAEPENGIIKSSLQFLKDRPNRMANGLFYRGMLIFISGNTELAVQDLKNYTLSAGKGNSEYVSEAKKLVKRYEEEKAAIAAARKAKKEHEALLAAKELAAKSQVDAGHAPPSDYMIQNMNVSQIIDEADRLSRESRVTDALAVIEKGLKASPNNLDLLMKSANAYTDLLLAKNDKEAGKMAIKRFQQVYGMTQANSREWTVAKDMIDELKKRIK